MATTSVAYNASDPLQTAFLSALALGESGNASNAIDLGTGNVDLSSAATDQYGFPEWAGNAGSHAAGIFQFQPGTWDPLANEYGLNFQNSSDQAEGAWYYAQQTYAQKTGGSLETALQNGDYASVQSALSGVWPSVTGNGSSQGLAYNLSNGIGANLGLSGSSSGSATSSQSGGTATSGITEWFQRFGLILIGGLIILIALWQLLSQTGAVPSPRQTVKAAGRIAASVA